MYDFLLMEEWWMETIIASVITAAATLIGSYLAYSAKMQKLIFRVEQLAEAMGKDVDGFRTENKETHAGLSNGHEKLSGEHGQIRDDLQKIYVNQEKEIAARQMMEKNLPDESGLLKTVEIVYGNHEKLLERIEKLNRKVVRVQEENRQLRNQINILSNSFDIPDLYSSASEEDEWEEEI